MRLHAAAVATLLLLTPALVMLADDGPFPRAPAPGPGRPDERPPPMARYDAMYLLNDTRVRAPTLPSWPASEGCLLLESWGGSTILAGGLYVTWSPEPIGGAEILELRVEGPGGQRAEVTGASPMELRLDGLVLHQEEPTKVLLRAADRSAPFVRQQATLRLGWDMSGGPISVTPEGCSAD